jgi:hypothetical protein
MIEPCQIETFLPYSCCSQWKNLFCDHHEKGVVCFRTSFVFRESASQPREESFVLPEQPTFEKKIPDEASTDITPGKRPEWTNSA